MKFIKSGNKSELTDAELIEQFRVEGDKNFVVILFDRYAHLVFGVCMKYLKDEDASKDASMEIFEKLFIDLEKHKIQHFKSWLYMVSKNHCLMQLRQFQAATKKMHEMQKDESAIMESGTEQHLEKVEKEIQFDNLSLAISELKEEQKTCVELFYLKEKSYQEIAERTGYSMMQVKSNIQNGKRNLKIILSKLNEKKITR